ncbi:MAG TPA: hypothetical protein VN541_14000 [Tepidisphaeraceae bacterium]|nr:hypothetical protein [Tepidisphaeraceae bacterium]
MPNVRVSIRLPYALLLPPGEYVTPGLGASVRLAEVTAEAPDAPAAVRTEASSLFDGMDTQDADSQERQRQADADRLLRRVNRHKMTTGLRLLVGRSLFMEPDGFWQELSASYALRNRIIHEGQIAHEDDARQAIRVARKIVLIDSTLSRSSGK